MKLIVRPIPALINNYIWLLTTPARKEAWVVDPGEAEPVPPVLEKEGLRLAGILLTHHHRDHSGGIEDLLSYAGKIPVVASHKSALTSVSQPVSEGARINVLGSSFQVFEIPGHTLDHVAYYNEGLVFTGDTLFSAGCGKAFEGTPAMLYRSLMKLCQLPVETQIYCGHEYTRQNLGFAETVEPENPDIQLALARVAQETCTLPSSFIEEKKFNPFLRCQRSTVIQAAEKIAGKALGTPEAVFATLREWKNRFK